MNPLQKRLVRLSAECERFLKYTDEMIDLTLPNGQRFCKQRVKMSLNMLVTELEKITNYTLRPDKSDNDAAQLQMLALVQHIDEQYNNIWNEIEIQIEKEEKREQEIKEIEEALEW